MKKTLLILALLALAAPAAALADGFCPSYGMGCYRQPKANPTFFLLSFGEKSGDYMGSIRLNQGQCGLLCCSPCEDAKRDTDWDAQCNQRFAECEGRCTAE